MPILGVYGHSLLRERLLSRVQDGSFPASVLLHGPPGIGKQRLALFVAQALLCESTDPPCGRCQHCRYALELTHPDLLWIFPRPRPKEAEATPEDVAADLAEATAARVESGGLYPRPPGSEGIYVATVRIVVRKAALAPALARRKVFVIGDAERMVPQEGAEMAANAFLKLLEEPPADTYLILTSSEPASLLPTVRSRVAAIRVAPVKEGDVRAFLQNEAVKASLGAERDVESLMAAAGGAPGQLFDEALRANATTAARRLVSAAFAGSAADIYEAALAQGVSGARGAFTDTLDSVTAVLAERTRDAIRSGAIDQARSGVRAIDAVETAKERASGNVNPQLVTWRLLHDLRSGQT